MGCDIHIITEIKENNKWKYVPEVPKTFNERNYTLFAILAGVRDRWNEQIFEVKGLPKDISAKKFNFIKCRDTYKNTYETGTTTCLVINNEIIGELLLCDDERYKRTYCEISEDEYNKLKEFQIKNYEVYKSRFADLTKISINNRTEYYVMDAAIVGGEWKKVLNKDAYPDINEFLKSCFIDDYNTEEKDYGCWEVDFDCADYHTPSYITLKEFENADYSKIFMQKAKISKKFFDTFVNFGGSLPKQMNIEDSSTSDIGDALSEIFSPTITVCWNTGETDNNHPLIKGVGELKEIANKYNIEDTNNIRIVFAFDN